MKRETYLSLLVGSAVLLALVAVARAQDPGPQSESGIRATAGTSFTYQGQVNYAGSPVNDTCDFEFSLWDAQGTGSPPTGGSQVGATQIQSSVAVSGQFVVYINNGNWALVDSDFVFMVTAR